MNWLDGIPPLPPLWQWIGVVCGIAALVVAIMALPTVAKMFWGKPIVRVAFDRYVEGLDRLLIAYLTNPPIRHRFLKMLGIRREGVQSLTGYMRISEAGSGKIVVPILHATFWSDETVLDSEPKSRITLPPTYSIAASFAVVRWDVKANKAFLMPDRLRKQCELTEGYYQADIILIPDGEPTKTISKRFVVGKTADDLVWVP